MPQRSVCLGPERADLRNVEAQLLGSDQNRKPYKIDQLHHVALYIGQRLHLPSNDPDKVYGQSLILRARRTLVGYGLQKGKCVAVSTLADRRIK